MQGDLFPIDPRRFPKSPLPSFGQLVQEAVRRFVWKHKAKHDPEFIECLTCHMAKQKRIVDEIRPDSR